MNDKIGKPEDPQPADPQQRGEPLPGQRQKPASEDPECQRKLDAILNNPSYIPAIEDTEFLDGDDARTVRLQLDFLKPDRLLRRNGIESTIVVFGSTRLVEPVAARNKVEELRKVLVTHPEDRGVQQQLGIAERIQSKSFYYDIAREFSQLVSQSGRGPGDSRLVVMTGGGPGIMEAANRGASESGGKTIGLNITLPREQYPNPYVTPELCFQFHYYALRKMHFILRARALVAFPGGYGTFDELFETLTLIQTRKIKPIPVVLVGEGYWRKAFDVDFMVEEGVIDAGDRELFCYAETAADIWEGLLRWYQRKGKSLIPDHEELQV